MSLSGFSEARFRSNVSKALEVARTVLSNARRLGAADEIPHTHADLYLLAEVICRTSAASQMHVLQRLGVTEELATQLQGWAQERSVTIRLESEERCEFVKKTTREQERATRHEAEFLGGVKVTDKVVDVIDEWFWTFSVTWKLSAFRGNDVEGAVTLRQRSGECTLMTTTETTPKPKASSVPVMDCNVTWLLNHADAFRIEREARSCRTPRRNEEVQAAVRAFEALFTWARACASYFTGRLFPVEPEHGLTLLSLATGDVVPPAVPLFDEEQQPPVLEMGDVHLFLAEERRQLDAKYEAIDVALGPGTKLITPSEGRLVALFNHTQRIAQSLVDGVNFSEDLLMRQLVAALGKLVTPVDFGNYMRFHNRKVFRAPFQPTPFSYHVRREEHAPEGVLSIEQNLGDGSPAREIETTVRYARATAPGRFALNASTHVSFLGHRYVHAWVDHQFGGDTGSSLTVSARARQFSSFILLCGTMLSGGEFNPKHAIIIKNKDDLRLPLLLETIPSAGEFRDAIASLSPEQQRFAKAYRGMQLSSTMFALLTIQIKPQMEVLLNLPRDGLTKEIQLTQDLQDLFLTYQIPSDLLRFDLLNNPGATDQQRVEGVRANVAAVHDMIQATKDKAKKLALEKAKLEEMERRKVMKRREKECKPSSSSSLSKMKVKRKKKKGAARPSKAFAMDAEMAMAPPVFEGADMELPVSDLAPAPEAPDSSPEPAPEADTTEPDLHASSSTVGPEVDVTNIPGQLDAKLEKLDPDGALRPTILSLGPTWNLKRKPGLLSDVQQLSVRANAQKDMRREAFDLLDALSRGGTLAIEYASLHVVIASTHCFEKSLMSTLVQDNVNPIEKLNRSNLIVASTIHHVGYEELLQISQAQYVKQYTPALFALEQEKRN